MMPKHILRQSAYSGAPLIAGDMAVQRAVLNGHAQLVWAYPVIGVEEHQVTIAISPDRTLVLDICRFRREWVRVHDSQTIIPTADVTT